MIGTPDLLARLAKLVRDLPAPLVERLAGALDESPCESPQEFDRLAERIVSDGTARSRLDEFLKDWQTGNAGSPQRLAAMLSGAAVMEAWHRQNRSIEIVGSGPAPVSTTLRRTDQALLELVRSAARRLLVVTYTAYKVPALRDALGSAMERKVDVHFVVENPEESGRKVSFDPMQAIGTESPSHATVWVWPRENRPAVAGGGFGLLHAKCAVADECRALVSSANLTGAAMDLNLEIGLLLTDPATAAALWNHFAGLMQSGVLRRLRA